MNQIFVSLPSIRVFQFFGMSPFAVDQNFQPKESRWLRFYSLLLIAMALIGLVLSFIQWDMYLNGLKSNTGYIADFLQLVGIRTAHVIILCESMYQRKTLLKFFENLCEVDKMMEKAKINIKVEARQRKNYLAIISVLLFNVGMQLMVLIINTVFREGYQVLYWVSYLPPFLVSCLRYFQAFNCVLFIRKRYEILNERLAQMQLKDEGFSVPQKLIPTVDFKLYVTDSYLKPSKPLKDFQQIVLMRQMYDKLYILSTMVNYSFGLSNLINISNEFVSITVNGYFVFLSLQSWPLSEDHWLRVIQAIFWCLPHLINIILISTVCHLAVYTVS